MSLEPIPDTLYLKKTNPLEGTTDPYYYEFVDGEGVIQPFTYNLKAIAAPPAAFNETINNFVIYLGDTPLIQDEYGLSDKGQVSSITTNDDIRSGEYELGFYSSAFEIEGGEIARDSIVKKVSVIIFEE